MVRITVDEKTSRELASAATPIEIQDANGRLLGRFLPAEEKSIYDGVEIPQLSEEEWERRRSGPFYTTNQVIEHLERRDDE